MPFVAALAGAAAASSFVAPAIISAVGATSVFATTAITMGTAAIGGGLGSKLAGGEFGRGALIGAGVGLVGPALGIGPEGTLFSSGSQGAAAGLFGGAASGTAPAAGATAGTTAATGIAGTAPAAAGVGAATGGGLLSGNMGQALTMMALSSFGKAPQDLTDEERRAMAEQARRQGIQENVFNQAFEQARMVAQRAVPDVEGAFARTQIGAMRQLDESVRGATGGQRDAARRRAALGATLAGAGGTAAEQQRADATAGQAATAFAGLRPPSQSAAEQSLAIYGDLYKRRQDYAADLARGAGTLFA
jgi:hypothetical protein